METVLNAGSPKILFYLKNKHIFRSGWIWKVSFSFGFTALAVYVLYMNFFLHDSPDIAVEIFFLFLILSTSALYGAWMGTLLTYVVGLFVKKIEPQIVFKHKLVPVRVGDEQPIFISGEYPNDSYYFENSEGNILEDFYYAKIVPSEDDVAYVVGLSTLQTSPFYKKGKVWTELQIPKTA